MFDELWFDKYLLIFINYLLNIDEVLIRYLLINLFKYSIRF